MRALLVLVVVGGCVADAERSDQLKPTTQLSLLSGSTEVDVCALAAELPDEDVCSKICDPDALAVQLAAEGCEAGACYQLYCALPENEHVLVGVCLPPS